MKKPENGELKARECARELLQKLKISSAPVPIERIIKKCNITLHFAPFEEDLSGMAYINDGLSIIGINALHHPNRQRFSAAHELGHHLLHESLLREEVHVDRGIRVMLRDGTSSQGTDENERAANAFAAELLMPRDLLVQAMDEGEIDIEDEGQVEVLAKKFRVSTAAMRFRLIGLMDGQKAA